MTNELNQNPDLKNAVASLKELASVPNTKKKTLRELIAEPELYEAIKTAKAQRYTMQEIAEKLNANGIKISHQTLQQYLGDIERETNGRTRQKATRKKSESTGSTKTKPTPVADEKKAETVVETVAEKKVEEFSNSTTSQTRPSKNPPKTEFDAKEL